MEENEYLKSKKDEYSQKFMNLVEEFYNDTSLLIEDISVSLPLKAAPYLENKPENIKEIVNHGRINISLCVF